MTDSAGPAAGPLVPVHIAAQGAMLPRARWVLSTLLAGSGARLEPVLEAERAPECLLAYAPAPIPGVPTLPVSAAARDLLLSGRPLPSNAFRAHSLNGWALTGAFPVGQEEGGAGFAVPFDLVASAFVLLGAWDEHTSASRDRHGRFPFQASVFATNYISLLEVPIDGYARFIRALVDRRLIESGQAPLAVPSWAGRAFAVALTHDVDHLRRWTPRGVAAALRRSVRAARRRDRDRLLFELQGLRRAVTHHLPHGSDPFWTFPQLLSREAAAGVRSTFFVIPSHGHRTDGNDPVSYARHRPELLRLLRDHGCEIGLHGNERDRRDLGGLLADRGTLAAAAGSAIDGMRFHYLRCLYHETLPLLERAGFLYDSSLGYAEQEGYRNGCSFPFHPYDLTGERPLRLVELPLAVMDSTLQEHHYRGLSSHAALPAALSALERIRQSGGAAALLWHQNRFDAHLGRGYGETYWRIVEWINDHNGAALSAGEIVRRWLARQGETA